MLIYLNLIEDEDKDYFKKTYENNYLMMYHVALSVLHHPEDAENAVHDAFISLAENFNKYKYNNEKQLSSLCNVIVRNKALDIIRKRNIRAESELDETLTVAINKEVENIIESEMGVQRIFELLEAMEEDVKLMFILKYYHDYKNEEIAKILKLPKRTVEMKIYRAKLKLKKELGYE